MSPQPAEPTRSRSLSRDARLGKVNALHAIRMMKLNKHEKEKEAPLFTIRFQSPELEVDCAVSDTV